jgi:hypothetical protein
MRMCVYMGMYMCVYTCLRRVGVAIVQVCVCVRMGVYIYGHVHLFIWEYIYVYAYLDVCIHVRCGCVFYVCCGCAYIFVLMGIYMYAFVYICAWMHQHLWVCACLNVWKYRYILSVCMCIRLLDGSSERVSCDICTRFVFISFPLDISLQEQATGSVGYKCYPDCFGYFYSVGARVTGWIVRTG